MQREELVFSQARRKLINDVDFKLLDFKHHSSDRLQACLTTLRRLCTNVLQHPTDAKYRKVRASNEQFRSTVVAVKGGEDFLVDSFWHITQTEDLERYWVFEAAEHSVQWRVLQEAVVQLDRGLQTITTKDEKAAAAKAAHKAAVELERERVHAQVEGDRAARVARALGTEPTSPAPVPATSPRPRPNMRHLENEQA